MKNIRTLITIFAFFTIFSCKDKIVKTRTEIKEKQISFTIDERTEFFRTIFNLGFENVMDEELRPCQTEYYKRLKTHFKKFENHPLINYINKNKKIGIDFSTIGLMYKNFEEFEFDEKYSKELDLYGIDKETLDSIKPQFLDFYKKTNFKYFFESNKKYYEKSLSNIEKQVEKEELFIKVKDFYQSQEEKLELIVFVELTNNANNKAVSFYDGYNPRKRAIILANICDKPNEPTSVNEILELDEFIRGQIYHESSHLFTDKLLEKHIGELSQYKNICEDCSEMAIVDKVDHLIVNPLQGLMMERFNQDRRGSYFFLTKCTDVRKEIYERLAEYKPEGKISFDKTYVDCINLIRQSTSEQ